MVGSFLTKLTIRGFGCGCCGIEVRARDHA